MKAVGQRASATYHPSFIAASAPKAEGPPSCVATPNASRSNSSSYLMVSRPFAVTSICCVMSTRQPRGGEESEGHLFAYVTPIAILGFDLATAGSGSAGVAFFTSAVSHHRQLAAFGARIARVALGLGGINRFGAGEQGGRRPTRSSEGRRNNQRRSG